MCGKQFTTSQTNHKFCSCYCRKLSEKEANHNYRIVNDDEYYISHTKKCEWCNLDFIAFNLKTSYCSSRCKSNGAWARRSKGKDKLSYGKERKRYKRAKANGRFDWDITLDKLINRDGAICYLCGVETDKNDYRYEEGTFIAGNKYPSIEHVIPISKGGTHSWDNVRIAHRICNSIKWVN